jgi:hypothetical protein
MFRVLPGRSRNLPTVSPSILPTRGFHSHSSPIHLEWFLFNSSQCVPIYVLRVRAFENTRTAADDE